MPQRPATSWESGWSPAATPPHAPEAVTLDSQRPAWADYLPDWLLRWAPPATLAAILISLSVHLIMLIIAAIIFVGGGQAGGGTDSGGGQGAVGVAVMTEAELGQMQNAGLDADAPAIAEVASSTLPTNDADLSVQDAAGGAGDQGGLEKGLGGITSGMGAGNISGGEGLGSGGGAGGGAASFFGLEARGTRFAYICDVSGSMDTTVGETSITRVEILKNELARSISALLQNARFYVCLFSSEPKALGDRNEWVSANDAGKQWAQRTIPKIAAGGSTEPLPAFKIVFALRPRPEAIYFMTDGEFDEGAATQIARMNAEWHIPIHCITFVSREGEKVMKKIAADSGGTYAHFSGPGGG